MVARGACSLRSADAVPFSSGDQLAQSSLVCFSPGSQFGYCDSATDLFVHLPTGTRNTQAVGDGKWERNTGFTVGWSEYFSCPHWGSKRIVLFFLFARTLRRCTSGRSGWDLFSHGVIRCCVWVYRDGTYVVTHRSL